MPAMWLDVDAALAEVPINSVALIDDTDFKTREESVTYNQAGLDLVWNFVTSAGAYTQTAVTPTDTAGDYDWVNQGNGMYSIEIPASGGASINNDTEGYGWFSGFATGILPWSGPIIGFRAAGLNDLLIDSAHSATRGLSGTALPAVAADGAGGLPISDAGGLDLDTKLANTNEVTAARMGALTDWINGGRLDLLLDAIPTTAMRGTDSAALASVCTEARLAALTDWINGGRLDLLLDAIPTTAMRGTDSAALASVCTEARLAELDAANIPTDIAAVPTVDEVWAKAMSDLAQGAPSATASVLTAINYLYEAWRNKITTTATLITVMKDDGTTGLVKSTISDDATTFSKGEMVTGA